MGFTFLERNRVIFKVSFLIFFSFFIKVKASENPNLLSTDDLVQQLKNTKNQRVSGIVKSNSLPPKKTLRSKKAIVKTSANFSLYTYSIETLREYKEGLGFLVSISVACFLLYKYGEKLTNLYSVYVLGIPDYVIYPVQEEERKQQERQQEEERKQQERQQEEEKLGFEYPFFSYFQECSSFS